MKNRNPNILHKLGTTSTTTKVEGVENLEETVQLTSKAIITAYQNNCPEKIWKQTSDTVWWLFNKGKAKND